VPRVYTNPNFSLSVDNNFDARLVGISLDKVLIGMICLVIPTQNKVDVSIGCDKMFYI